MFTGFLVFTNDSEEATECQFFPLCRLLGSEDTDFEICISVKFCNLFVPSASIRWSSLKGVDDQILRDGVKVEIDIVCVSEVDELLRASFAETWAYRLLKEGDQVREVGHVLVVLMRCRGCKALGKEGDVGEGFLANRVG